MVSKRKVKIWCKCKEVDFAPSFYVGDGCQCEIRDSKTKKVLDEYYATHVSINH